MRNAEIGVPSFLITDLDYFQLCAVIRVNVFVRQN